MPKNIPNTNRQACTLLDGTRLQRAYVYLPESVWHLLQQQARDSHQSVSQLIETFANSGDDNLKDNNEKSTI
jgi:hypothetical protein